MIVIACGEIPDEISKNDKLGFSTTYAVSFQEQTKSLCDCISDECHLEWYDGGDVNSANAIIKAKSQKVQELQQLLIKRGYLDVNDSSYGSTIAGEVNRAFFSDFTQLMLSSFQSWNRLSRIDGVLDQETVDRLCEPIATTKNGYAKNIDGVDLDGYTEQEKIDYFVTVFNENNPEQVSFNRQAYGVNFIHIRGYADNAAIQNIPNKFNDTIIVIINDSYGKPDQLEEITASADYGNIIYYASTVFGYYPNPMKNSIVGPEWISEKGFPITTSGRVMYPYFGRHINGSGTERGMGFIDAWNDESGDYGVHASVDWNHNGQIDESEVLQGILGINEGVGNNFHYGSESKDGVHNLSAGCHTIPRDGSYQKFTKIIIESGQIQSYMYKRMQYYMNEKHLDEITAKDNAVLETVGNRQSVEMGRTEHVIVYDSNDTLIHDKSEANRFRINYIDGNERSVFMGPQRVEDYSFSSVERSNIRFAFLVIDSRDLPEPPTPSSQNDDNDMYENNRLSGRRMR